MKRSNNSSIYAISALAIGLTSSFVYSPVFADGPVDIRIVELVNDDSGELKPWEDITGAMPGMTYSAIPRVKNDGTVSVDVRMCLSESAVNASGESVTLPANTFGITINEHWIPEYDGNTSDPASGNCYKYESKLNVGDLTEPFFNEVTLSSNLGNTYQGNTFTLHLEAEAKEDADDGDDDDDGGDTPLNPDTGANTASYFDIVSPVFYASGAVLFFAILAFILRQANKRK